MIEIYEKFTGWSSSCIARITAFVKVQEVQQRIFMYMQLLIQTYQVSIEN